MNWQPIETAPKDGTYFLAFPALMGVPLILVWDVQCEYFRAAMTGKGPPFKPTHWMPLPAPPESTDQTIDRLVRKATEGGSK